jgi:mxaA protein
MKHTFRLIIATLLSGIVLLAAAPARALMPKVDATVEQPRRYGLMVGDLLVQRVLLEHEGVPLQLKELPRKERVAVWFSRYGSREDTDAAGRRWLVLTYQLINSAKDVTTVTLPAQSLVVNSPQGELPLEIAEWPVSVSPVTPRFVDTPSGLPALQADLPVPLPDSAPLAHRLRLTLAALACVLLLWLGWTRWRDFQAARHQPFARAWRELRSLSTEDPQAWRNLHRAFDATSGSVVQIATLAQLFERAPQFLPLQERIAAFYAASAARFFAGSRVGADPHATQDLRELCRQLRRIEKRQ